MITILLSIVVWLSNTTCIFLFPLETWLLLIVSYVFFVYFCPNGLNLVYISFWHSYNLLILNNCICCPVLYYLSHLHYLLATLLFPILLGAWLLSVVRPCFVPGRTINFSFKFVLTYLVLLLFSGLSWSSNNFSLGYWWAFNDSIEAILSLVIFTLFLLQHFYWVAPRPLLKYGGQLIAGYLTLNLATTLIPTLDIHITTSNWHFLLLCFVNFSFWNIPVPVLSQTAPYCKFLSLTMRKHFCLTLGVLIVGVYILSAAPDLYDMLPQTLIFFEFWLVLTLCGWLLFSNLSYSCVRLLSLGGATQLINSTNFIFLLPLIALCKDYTTRLFHFVFFVLVVISSCWWLTNNLAIFYVGVTYVLLFVILILSRYWLLRA